jgi:hypothetical protein
MTAIAPDVLVTTRRSLHGVAEMVMASSQFDATGMMRLRPLTGGFGTVVPHRDIHLVAVAATDLVLTRLSGRTARWPLSGTYRALAATAGLPFDRLRGVYPGGSGVGPDDEIDVDAAAAGLLADALATGDAALRTLGTRIAGPQAPEPVLWPEHFDVAIAVDEVTYGVSAGDDTLAEPYAYVSPGCRRTGAFWNQTFGAARPLRDLGGGAGVLGFLAEGHRQVDSG